MARWVSQFTVAVALVAGLVAPAAAQTKPLAWDMMMNVGLTHFVGGVEKEFVEDIRKRTNGALAVTLRPPGELPYKLPEYLRAVGQGHSQMGDVYMGFLAGDSRIAVLTGLPFLVANADELRKAMAVLEPLIREDFARFGTDVLTWYTWPEQNFFGRGKPITTVDEFKGRKIRTTSPEQSELVKRLGGVPISMPAPEVPSAAQRGVMEGVITAGFNLYFSKWYEFTEWAYLPDIHIGGPAYILVNKGALASLSPEARRGLQEAAQAFQARMLKEIPAREQSDLKTLETRHGIKLIRANPVDVEKMRKLMAPYWDEWAKQGGPKLVEALARVRKAVGR
ncbi:MAG: TRAP transporter substrate-binding protein DctP [Candidatus Rokubacteria bacterium]|nr:TRAP transporter substrate-binding protein DctP [Candidatus Rokubacteria bacterium]MBI2491537.1 TRAP transporter substrate-binding protein DctP [Candidatus Rokubacteria bacterium]MBI4255253.1 TRAP transporter substrate-binding protein DctP [Candidatus Rokubacteria bacterium]